MLFGIDYATWIIGIVALLIGVAVYRDQKNSKPQVYDLNTLYNSVQDDDDYFSAARSWSGTNIHHDLFSDK